MDTGFKRTIVNFIKEFKKFRKDQKQKKRRRRRKKRKRERERKRKKGKENKIPMKLRKKELRGINA